eukprot:TRINITY_DN5751_c0_g1_i1.p1 TRINITY_DN5751_c0_g1~~TRINITY_DN5751_c0_g1_i1.p1  ORF type:complete len:285 (-),score=87.23 TRINITY_DN5751_c0_g1_i1:293-1147(-)
MSNAGWHAYLADLTQAPNLRPHRGVIMGIENSVGAAAWIAGPAIGGLLCEHYGPRLGFLLVGAAIGLCAGVLALLPETLKRPTGDQPAGPGAEPELSRKGLRALLADRSQQGVMAAHFALSLNYAANMIVIPLMATSRWGASPGQVGLLFSLLSVMSLVVSPMAGLCADRNTRKAVLIPSLFLMAIGSLTIGLSTTLPIFNAAAMVWSLGEAFFLPALSALTADCAPPTQKGEALALSRQVSDLGFAVGPLLMGILYDAGGPIAALGALGLINVLTAARGSGPA